jgi:hypothetical protein
VVFVINWHDEIIHFGHFHTIFGTLKCQISIFNSFSIKKKSAENLENCGITFRKKLNLVKLRTSAHDMPFTVRKPEFQRFFWYKS